MSQKTVAVVGAGYVGLPVACAFAGAGMLTYAIDVIPERVRMINESRSPILGDEPGLQELLANSVKIGTLIASTDATMVSKADSVVVCVDTPVDEETKQPRLDILKTAVRSIGQSMKAGTLVSIESTMPPLTMKNVVIPLLEERSGMKAGVDFFVAHCPERVMPGRLLRNLSEYDRVLGGLNERSTELALDLYKNIVHGQIHPTDLVSAEMAKTLENAYRDVQIAFANEVALACEELGADAFEVRRLVNTCPFRDMHIPGAGVGGHCLPKDSWLFASSLHEFKPTIITSARETNERMPVHMAELVEDALKEAGRELADSKVAILGLAFLRDSDDTRHSPALTIIDQLEGKVGNLIVHDPMVQKPYKIKMVRELADALKDADCMVIVTNHSCYDDLDLQWIRSLMRTPFIVDGRNIMDATKVIAKGFRYLGIGKGN